MTDRTDQRVPVPRWLVAAAAVVLGAGAMLAGLAAGGFFRGRNGVRHAGPNESAALPTPAQLAVPEDLKTYDLVATYATGLTELRGLAVDSADRIYVAGDEEVRVYDSAGRPLGSWPTGGPARCVAVGQSGTVYVGLRRRVETYHPAGTPLAAWGQAGREPGRLDEVTGIAVAEPNVYVADAGNRCVHRFATDGDFVLELGKRDPEAGVPGIIVPSPYLDCAIDAEGVVHVTNPGRLQVERYTADGRYLGAWGRSGNRLDQFWGCCNPTNLALAPGGRVVTSEKGVNRVKVYDAAGTLRAVLGAEVFVPGGDESGQGRHRPSMDVAVDSAGRILVTDPAAGAVRVFAPK